VRRREARLARQPEHSNEPRELHVVVDGEFLEAEFREAQAESSHELQLVLDPEFL
jgi:hypothetical protein